MIAQSTRSRSSTSTNGRANRKAQVRYAVVGLGYIAQVAVLPAFKHARKNSQLVALISDDPAKLKKLGRKYDVAIQGSYDQYDELMRSGDIDAVYIALPNSMHAEYTIRAASAGVHVLCEKPMAVTEEECRQMIDACRENNVKLMIAYRLHFEEANLKAIKIVQFGKLGEPRFFNSVFSMAVKNDNIRTERKLGGGTLYDLGIYCINAARYLFRAEPIEVTAFSESRSGDRRFTEVDEMTSAIMRFPDDRLATFISSFGGASVGYYEVVGTKGDLCVDPAYDYAYPIEHWLTIKEKTKKTKFAKRDQFAPELLHFSDCVLKNKEPEPSGEEGLIDVRIIVALYHSAQTGQPVPLGEFPREQRPSLRQEIKRRPVREPEMVHAESPSED